MDQHMSRQQVSVGMRQLMSQGDQEPREDLLSKTMTPATSLPHTCGEAFTFQTEGKAVWPEEERSACTWSQ